MKFLCDQCKAKYQIADDKVAGKTVKMKCRKCGHLIEVRAAVTESVEAGDSLAPGPRAAPMATSLSRMDAPRPSRDALAGAFAKSVNNDEPAARSIALSPGDEWYVAINGVPVGPVRIGEIRRKAAVGGVTEDSLCWQEGFEEWRPVKAVPELAEMVREANSSGRASLVPESRPPGAPRAPMRQASSPAMNRISNIPAAPTAPRPHSAPAAPQQASARAGLLSYDDDDETVVGSSSASGLAAALAATKPVAPHAAISVAPDPFAAPPGAALAAAPVAPPAPAVAPRAANPFAPAGTVDRTDPFAADVPSPLGVPFAAQATPLTQSGLDAPPRRAAPILSVPLLVLLVIGGAFGITAAIVLFLRPAATVAVTAPSATPSASAPTAASSLAANNIPPPDPSDTAAPSDSSAAAVKNSGGKSGGAAGTKSTTATPAGSAPTTGGKVDPSIAALLNGSGSGPSAGSGSGSGGGGSALTQDQIEAVVRQRSASVKRSCWEHSATSAKSNNTTVALTISGSGSVSSSSASGNDPTISHCIESATKNWQFPPSSGSTTVNIPFHFLSQ